ncbi:MAG: aldolase [Alphaproteobacteria bacterium]|nr:aldolase [Alphaproteobacteria bacterium]
MRSGFSEALRHGRTVGCFWLSLGSVPLAEFAGDAGVDAVVFDRQHGLWSRSNLENAIGLIKDRLIVLVRVADCSRFDISTALDAGAEGVIIPLIETAEQAARAVDWSRYPPHGSRSGGGVRPLADFSAYRKQADQATVVALMIETRTGLDNVDAIARTPGLDMIFIGTGDLSLSLGLAMDDPALEHAIQEIRQACDRADISCGIFTPDIDQARKRRDQGYQLVVLNDDITSNRQSYRTGLTQFTAE